MIGRESEGRGGGGAHIHHVNVSFGFSPERRKNKEIGTHCLMVLRREHSLSVSSIVKERGITDEGKGKGI